MCVRACAHACTTLMRAVVFTFVLLHLMDEDMSLLTFYPEAFCVITTCVIPLDWCVYNNSMQQFCLQMCSVNLCVHAFVHVCVCLYACISLVHNIMKY